MWLYIISIFFFIILLPGTMDLAWLSLGAFVFRKPSSDGGNTVRFAVVIPAHNEEKNIQKAICSLKKCRGSFEIIVVADNCEDETARLSQELGVQILERSSSELRGKHHALKTAFDSLLKREYDWFVVVDADTLVDETLLEEISKAAASGAQAVQVRYDILHAERSYRTRLMRLAFMSIGLRQKGRDALGLSAIIQGNGFALSREVLEVARFDVDSAVEDLAYSLEVVRAGYKVRYCDTTSVFAAMPASGRGVYTQRYRWEVGRFRLLMDQGASLAASICKGQWGLVEPLLDLLLLPLAYHAFVLLLFLMCSSFSWLSLLFFGILVFHMGAALHMGKANGRDLLTLAAVPYYIAWKICLIPLIVYKVFSKKFGWQRTERN